MLLTRPRIMAERRPPKLTFTHARLLVNEYQACFRFYRDTLGFDVEWGDEDGVYADFRTGDTTLALFDRRAMVEVVETNEKNVDPSHQDAVTIVFEVDDVDEAYKRLHGDVEFITEPHDQAGWGIRVAHFRDPEGTLIEINEPLTPMSD